MCKRVVLPALSSPRNKILADLFASPNDCKMSKNQFTINIEKSGKDFERVFARGFKSIALMTVAFNRSY